MRAACRYALENGLPSVTLVHKGNIMKFTEGGFKKWGYELAEREFDTFGLTPDQLAKTLVAVTGIHQHDMRALLPVLAD